MKTCPSCAETIPDQAILCRFCGRSLVATAPGQYSTSLMSACRNLGSLSIDGLDVEAGFLASVFGILFLVFAVLRLTTVLPRTLVASVVAGTGLLSAMFVIIKIVDLADDGSLGVGILTCLGGAVVAIVAAGVGLTETGLTTGLRVAFSDVPTTRSEGTHQPASGP